LSSNEQVPGCPLCEGEGGDVLYQDALLRVVAVTDAEFADYAGHLRVILNRHVREMTELPTEEAERVLGVVLACEKLLREVMLPDKINLASLGNQVAHIHWHIVPRYCDDPHFPGPIWAERRRDVSGGTLGERRRRAAAIGESLRLALS